MKKSKKLLNLLRIIREVFKNEKNHEFGLCPKRGGGVKGQVQTHVFFSTIPLTWTILLKMKRPKKNIRPNSEGGGGGQSRVWIKSKLAIFLIFE